MQILPPAPILTIAELEVASRRSWFTVEAPVGVAPPHGYADKYPASAGLTAAMLRATAVAVAGIPERPVICSSRVDPAATRDVVRVSKKRAGSKEVYPEPTPNQPVTSTTTSAGE